MAVLPYTSMTIPSTEASSAPADLFSIVDRNRDGIISRSEFHAALENHILSAAAPAPAAALTGAAAPSTLAAEPIAAPATTWMPSPQLFPAPATRLGSSLTLPGDTLPQPPPVRHRSYSPPRTFEPLATFPASPAILTQRAPSPYACVPFQGYASLGAVPVRQLPPASVLLGQSSPAFASPGLPAAPLLHAAIAPVPPPHTLAMPVRAISPPQPLPQYFVNAPVTTAPPWAFGMHTLGSTRSTVDSSRPSMQLHPVMPLAIPSTPYSYQPSLPLPSPLQVGVGSYVEAPPSEPVATSDSTSQVATLSAALAQRDAQIQKLERQLKQSGLMLTDREDTIAELARQNKELSASSRQRSEGTPVGGVRRLPSSGAAEIALPRQSSSPGRETPEQKPSPQPVIRPLVASERTQQSLASSSVSQAGNSLPAKSSAYPASSAAQSRQPSEGYPRMPAQNGVDQRQQLSEPQRPQERSQERPQERPQRPPRSKTVPRPSGMDPPGRQAHRPLPTIPQDDVPQIDDRPSSAPQSIDGNDMDEVDEKIQSYFEKYPDFCVDATKVRKGWYLFGKPIGKKVFMKTIGKHRVVVRVGGGYKSLDEFFDNYR